MDGPMFTRRQVFEAGVAGVTAGLAGCLGDTGAANERTDTNDPAPALQLDGVTLSSGNPVVFVDPDTGDRIANVHWHDGDEYSHWHFEPMTVPYGSERRVRVILRDDEEEPVPLGPDEPVRMAGRVNDGPDQGAGELAVEFEGDIGTFVGEAVGRVEFVAEILQDGDVVWESPSLRVEISDADG